MPLFFVIDETSLDMSWLINECLYLMHVLKLLGGAHIWRSFEGHRGKSGRDKIQEQIVSICMMMMERLKVMTLVPPWKKSLAIHSFNNVLRYRFVGTKDSY